MSEALETGFETTQRALTLLTTAAGRRTDHVDAETAARVLAGCVAEEPDVTRLVWAVAALADLVCAQLEVTPGADGGGTLRSLGLAAALL